MATRLQLLHTCMRRGRRYYAGAAAGVVLATAFAQLAPLILRFLIDSVIGDEPPNLPLLLAWVDLSPDVAAGLRERLWVGGLLLLGCAGGQGLFGWCRARWASQGAETFACNLRERLYDHVNRMPYQAQTALDTGDLIQRCSSDVETLRLFLESQAVELARIAVMLGLAIPIMAMLDAGMTVWAVVLLPLVIVGSVYYFFRVRSLYAQVTSTEAKLSTVVQESLTGVRLVKAFGREEFERERFARLNEAYRDAFYRMMRAVSAYWGGSAFLCLLQIVLVVLVGARKAAAGDLTIGTLTVFVMYAQYMVWPIRMLGHVLSDAGRAHVSLGRVGWILDQPVEPPEPGAARPRVRGSIEFRHVSFAYGDGEPVLQDVSFRVEAGQTVALLGRTGSGKSTLVHLLPRFIEPDSGEILLDGTPLKSVDRTWLRRRIGTCLQDPFLFSRTVAENIRLGGHGEPEHRLLEAAHIADIHRTVEETFEQGYNTIIGERGVTLSGGQRQRLAIARAILSDPAILIFDDSLSAVDAETDRRIQRALRERHGKATTFLISHRISSLSGADLILVLDNGRIVQSGTHRELAGRDGLYRRLCAIQDLLAADLKLEEAG